MKVKKIVLPVIAGLIGLSLITGCGQNKPAEGPESEGRPGYKPDTEEVTETPETQEPAADDAVTSSGQGTDPDSGNAEDAGDETGAVVTVPGSEAELYDHMQGIWYFVNPVTGEDYATIDIKDDGSFVYGYTGSREECRGEFVPNHLYSGEKDTPLTFTVNVSGIDKMTFDESVYLPPEDGRDRSDDKIYFGSCDGEDFIYMEETGNGDSFTGSVLFQDPGSADGSFYREASAFMMHRESKAPAAEPVTGGSFYAWIWQADDGGFWAQEMEPLTWDGEDEYTLRRYTAAAFEPASMESAYYELTDAADTGLLLHGSRIEMKYPRMICRLTTDSAGKITDIEEVDRAFYGMYDLGDIAPETSFEGMTFTYNGIDYDLTGMGVGNAIMGVSRAYGKVIVECHVNPHMSEYWIYDTFRGEFSPEAVYGGCLIWQGDDFSTAIYSEWNDVRNLWGDLLYHAEGTEILSLSDYDDGEHVTVSYITEGSTDEIVASFTMPENRDKALCAYCDYADSGRAGDFRRFMEYAPDDAAFLAVTEPQKWFGAMMYPSDEIEPEGFSTVMIAALYDNSALDIYNAEHKKCIDTRWIDRGNYAAYKMTVSESLPMYTASVTVSDPGHEMKANWPVAMISGETYQHSIFVTK